MLLKTKKLVSLATIFALLGAEQAKASFKVSISGIGYSSEYKGGEGDFVGTPTDSGFELKYDPLQPDHETMATATFFIHDGSYKLGKCTIEAVNDKSGGPRVTVKSSDEKSLDCSLIIPSGARLAENFAYNTALLSTAPVAALLIPALVASYIGTTRGAFGEEESFRGEGVDPKRIEDAAKQTYKGAINKLAADFVEKLEYHDGVFDKEFLDSFFKEEFETLNKALETYLGKNLIEGFLSEQVQLVILNELKEETSKKEYDRTELGKKQISLFLALGESKDQAGVKEKIKDDALKDIFGISENSDGAGFKEEYSSKLATASNASDEIYKDFYSPDKVRAGYTEALFLKSPETEANLVAQNENKERNNVEKNLDANHTDLVEASTILEDKIVAHDNLHPEHWYEHEKFRTTAAMGIGFLIVAAIPIFAWFGILGTQAKDLNFEVKVGLKGSPLPGKELRFLDKLPSGGVALVGSNVSLLGGPKEYTLLMDEKFENSASTNPKDYPAFRVLPGKATGLPAAYYDEANEQTLLAVPTTNGLSIVQVDQNAQVKTSTTPTVLFAGKKIENVKFVLDKTTKRLVAVFNVAERIKEEATGKEVTRIKAYVLRNDVPSFSPSSREEHFVEFKHAAVDKDKNIYYAFAGEKGLKVLTPQGSSEPTVKDSNLPSTIEVQRVASLPAGGVLAFTSGGLYHAAPSGQFERVPESLVSLQADDMMGVILAPKADATDKQVTDKQVSKILFYPAQKIEQGKKGALLVTMPVGGSPASWQVEKVFADEYVSSFEEDSSIVHTVQTLELAEEKVVKNYYISPTQLVNEKAAISEISDASYTPEVGSSTLVYALKPKGVLLVDRSSDTERLLAQTSEQAIEQIEMLPNSGRLALIGKLTNTHEPILQVIDKEGRELQTLKFNVGDKISLVSSYPEGAQGNGDTLLISTSDGLLVYKEGLVGSGYKLAYKLFKGTPIDASYVDTDGKLTVYSKASFSSGFRFNTPFANLSQEIGDEMDGEVLDQE